LRVWDLARGEVRRSIPLDREFSPSGYSALALSPGGGTLAVLSATQTIHLFDTNGFRERFRFQGPESVLGSAFADNHTLVIWTGDLKVSIWDAIRGRQLREYPLTQDLRIGQPKF